MNLHARILNFLIFRHNYKSYLEIGLNDPNENFIDIMLSNKESCDPYVANEHPDTKTEITPLINKYLTYHMTSDDMFKNMPIDKKYDLIFIDGLHEGNQVVKDVINSLKHLNKNGVIVIHDCLPKKSIYTDYPYKDCEERHYPNGAVDKTWNGTTWTALPTLEKMGIKFETVDVEMGLGLVKYQEGDFKIIDVDKNLTWESVFSNIETRNKILHVINEETFLNIY